MADSHVVRRHEVTDPQLNTDYHATNAEVDIHGSLSTKITIAVKRSERSSWAYEYDDWDMGLAMGFYEDDGGDLL